MVTTTEPETTVAPEPAPKHMTLRRRVMSRISIQSKLLVMLLVTSILSAAVVGFIGYQSGRSSLRASVFDRLTEVRASQSRQLEAKFADLEDSLITYTRGATTTEAIQAFTPAFDQLNDATINPAQSLSMLDYYNNSFRTAEQAQTGNNLDVDALLPTSNAQKYLQAYYTAPFNDWDKAIRFDDARDGSAWSAANARFNDFFREIVLRFQFEDALLLDNRGNVVYTAPTSSPARTARAYSATRTRRHWPPTPLTMSASPTSATTSPPTSPPRGWCRRSRRRDESKASWRCSSRSRRSAG